jgi:hypothetical protein
MDVCLFSLAVSTCVEAGTRLFLNTHIYIYLHWHGFEDQMSMVFQPLVN